MVSTPPNATFAPLVVDDREPSLRRFRSTDQGGTAPSGLALLRCSGSAQPSEQALQTLANKLPGAAERWLVDLRAESHGFVNGAAVSWFAELNWGAAGLAEADALDLERIRLSLLGRSREVDLADAATLKRGERGSLKRWPVHNVSSEAALAARFGLQYLRLPVDDHAAPTASVVDRFVTWFRAVDESAFVHFHCRGGRGRTSCFLLLFDLLRSGPHEDSSSIRARQRDFSGYDPEKLPAPDHPKRAAIEARARFLERFEHYASSDFAHGRSFSDFCGIGTQPPGPP